jgi:hypothetical protein
MKLQDGKIGTIISDFTESNSTWNWTLQEGALPENINAITESAQGRAVTIVDYSKFNQATNLAVARTIIHELVHAHLLLFFQFNTPQASVEYPGIVRAWYSGSKPDYNAIQHEEMAISFVSDIALSLKEFSENQNVFYNDNVYADLAWGGLDYQNNPGLDETDKERIEIRVISAQLNMSTFEVSKNVLNTL